MRRRKQAGVYFPGLNRVIKSKQLDLMRRTYRSYEQGYTIVEVLVVLLVTMLLFIATAVMLSGKQAQTESTQSVRALDSSLQSLSREVASGRYESSYTCIVNSGNVVINSGSKPGGNTGCIFLGKLVKLHDKDATIINLVGRQFVNGTTNDVSKLSEAEPTRVDDTETLDYTYDLKLNKIYSPTNVSYSAIAFMIELAGGVSSGDNVVTGSRGIQLYGIKGGISNSDNVDLSKLELLPSGVVLCITTGTNKNVKLTIGESGNQYSTYTTYYDTSDPPC